LAAAMVYNRLGQGAREENRSKPRAVGRRP
jgi:hypothetical protein